MSLPFMARRAGRVTAAAMALAAISASPAGAACAKTSTTKAFASLGDSADYTLAPGGSFETGTAGWALGGASLVSGNETFAVGSKTDARSLAVPAKAKAVSPVFCVGQEHPTFRLFARKTSGTWASMLVKLRWTDTTGRVNETTVTSLDGGTYSKWAATPPLKLATTLPITTAAQSLPAQIVLDPEDTGGNWQVDDLYIDPYRRS